MTTLRRTGLLSVCVVVALLAAPLLGLGAPALAQCDQTGSAVDCTGTDTDGFQSGATVQVTVETGAVVNNNDLLSSNTIDVGNNSTLTNDGTISADGAGIYAVRAMQNATIVNNGTIEAAGGLLPATLTGGLAMDVLNNANITNNGTIEATGRDGYALRSWGYNTTLVNNGTMSASGEGAVGIQLKNQAPGATANITNNGTIEATGATTAGSQVVGLSIYFGDSNVTNSGTINGTSGGVQTSYLGAGVDHVTNSGTINGGDGLAIGTGGGNDTVVNSGTAGSGSGSGTAIGTGAGDDSVTLTGSAPVVNGIIDGGADTDSLTFAFDVLDVDYAAVSAQIAAAAPSGGSLTYSGRTYTWLNFEQLINLLNQVATGGGGTGGSGGSTGGSSTFVVITVGGIADGRLNSNDLAATAIPYCGAGGQGLDVYAVTESGVQFAFRVDVAAMQTALSAAQSGAAVSIASELGASLVAADGTHLLVFGPGGYSFGFEANVCGLG